MSIESVTMTRIIFCAFIIITIGLAKSAANGSDEALNPALLKAIEVGDMTAFNSALKAGADINAKSDKGAPALAVAILSNQHDIALRLIEAGASLNAQYMDYIGATPLMLTVQMKAPNLAYALLASGGDVNFRDANGDPAINWAAYYGYIDFVELFLKHGASTSFSGHGKAREIAMRRGFQGLTKLLARHDNIPLPTPDTAMLIDAVEAGDLEGVLEALMIGVSANSLDFTGRPTLALAARKNNPAILNALIQKGALVDNADEIGFTALMEAVRDNKIDATKLLLNAGASVKHVAKPSALSLGVIHMAALSGNPDMVDLIAKAGANLDLIGRDGGTAMAWGYGAQNNEAVARLLELGANPYIKNKYGESAADWIKQSGPSHLLGLLKPKASFSE